MTAHSSPRIRNLIVAAAIAVTAGVTGYVLAKLQEPRSPPAAYPPAVARRVLYYYDPMSPAQHFDKPGKSPFMDMQLTPRYADAGANGQADVTGVPLESSITQNLGVRLARVERGNIAQSLDASGVLDFNQRDVAVVQARASGFVQRVYARAPGDVVRSGAPLVDLLIPSWTGAQAEYLAVRAGGDPALEAAARQRLLLLGMSDALIARVARNGRPYGIVTITSPITGDLQTLEVRQGMTVSMGQTLAQVSGISSVWLNAAVPEAMAAQVHVGGAARAELAAFPGEAFAGRVATILPSAQTDSRTLTVRIELSNHDGRLRPGMFATVHLVGAPHMALSVPSEAVIRTGARSLIMASKDGGRFQPIEVRTGRNIGERTEILAGVVEGQKIVASGQFLLDSEASLTGINAVPLGTPLPTPLRSAR